MEMSESYCQLVRSGGLTTLHNDYHDQEYGSPQRDESILFERLTLETFQAGLSWEIVLKKRSGLYEAFRGFDVDTVATFGPDEVDTILANPNVIRNRKKVEAAVFNAQAIQQLRIEFGGFANWLDVELATPESEWVSAFKSRFKFMGGEVVGEFLISLGLIAGAHDEDCPVGKMDHMGDWAVHASKSKEKVAAK